MTNSKKPQKSSNLQNMYKGAVQITRSGMAFVIIEGQDKDVMVRQQNLNTALDGDVVLVNVIKQGKNKGRMEGVVTEIITRKKTEFTGTLQVNKGFAFLILDKSLFMPDIYIPANVLKDGKTGDKALVRVVSWGDKTRKPVGEI